MKREYIIPVIKVVRIIESRMLMISGPSAGDQGDPSLGSRDDADLFPTDDLMWGDSPLNNLIR